VLLADDTTGILIFVLAVLALVVVPMFVAVEVTAKKGRGGGLGLLLGLILGWIGVIIALVLSDERSTQLKQAADAALYRECPYCREPMRRDASVCPHCRRESEAWTRRDEAWWVQRGDDWYRLDPASGQWHVGTPAPETS